MKIKEYDYEPIGARIKRARLNRKYTQEYLAEAVNVTCQHISDIERSINGISISTLMDICKALDTDSDYILFGTVTRDNHNPLNKYLAKMTPQQSMYAEEILIAYSKSCGIK